MARFLIELTHGDEGDACLKALRAIAQSGSHFVTQAEWGCVDGTHCGWLVVDVDSRKEAAQIVPPEFRNEARVVELNRFTKEKINEMIAKLKD